MNAALPRGIAVTGVASLGDPGEEELAPYVDLGRLRRMDRFARNGFLAGSRALLASGFRKPEAPDPETGVFFGTALGCRESIATHALTLLAASRLEDLGPAVFARTVHTSAASELAIAWNLGGPCEVAVSGRCAGIEALLLAFDRLRARGRGRHLVVAAEGIDDWTRLAWNGEREARRNLRPGAGEVPLVESAAALVLEPEPPEASRAGGVFLKAATSFFEPGPDRARERLASWLLAAAGTSDVPLSLPSEDLDGTLEPGALEAAGLRGTLLAEGAPAGELLGVAGLAGSVTAVRAIESGAARYVAVLVRDPEGSAGGLLFSFAS